ncbi:hypothetical protein Bca52824_018336 [Brassica carinata]|uniref:Uncharacterized protein n=1 Tax=Brassica carinata TaxID=52824 RepID=A0A8X7VPW4_BRACI|nr:hypothetical protein Bca52824_018336 [Brassica carinata]
MDLTSVIGGELESASGNGVVDALPPPPPIIPPNVEPMRLKPKLLRKKKLRARWTLKKKKERVPMARPGFGLKGQKIPLFTNHFKVNVANLQAYFYRYSVRFHTTHTTVMFISSVV